MPYDYDAVEKRQLVKQLIYAAECGDIEKIKSIMQKKYVGYTETYYDSNDNCIYYQHERDVYFQYIESLSKIHTKTGQNLLQIAIRNLDVKLIEFLLNNGCRVTAKNMVSKSPHNDYYFFDEKKRETAYHYFKKIEGFYKGAFKEIGGTKIVPSLHEKLQEIKKLLAQAYVSESYFSEKIAFTWLMQWGDNPVIFNTLRRDNPLATNLYLMKKAFDDLQKQGNKFDLSTESKIKTNIIPYLENILSGAEDLDNQTTVFFIETAKKTFEGKLGKFIDNTTLLSTAIQKKFKNSTAVLINGFQANPNSANLLKIAKENYDKSVVQTLLHSSCVYFPNDFEIKLKEPLSDTLTHLLSDLCAVQASATTVKTRGFFHIKGISKWAPQINRLIQKVVDTSQRSGNYKNRIRLDSIASDIFLTIKEIRSHWIGGRGSTEATKLENILSKYFGYRLGSFKADKFSMTDEFKFTYDCNDHIFGS